MDDKQILLPNGAFLAEFNRIRRKVDTMRIVGVSNQHAAISGGLQGDSPVDAEENQDVRAITITGTNSAAGTPLDGGIYACLLYTQSASSLTAGTSGLPGGMVTNGTAYFLNLPEFGGSAHGLSNGAAVIGLEIGVNVTDHKLIYAGGSSSNIFATARVSTPWVPNANTIAVVVGTNTKTLDLDWPGSFGTNALFQPYCGLNTTNCTVAFAPYTGVWSGGSNYGLAIGWDRWPPTNGTSQPVLMFGDSTIGNPFGFGASVSTSFWASTGTMTIVNAISCGTGSNAGILSFTNSIGRYIVP